MWDVWSYITNFIERDNDKCRLMMTCKQISQKRFYFNEQKDINKMINLEWYNNFINVITLNNHTKLPLFITHLTFGSRFNQPIIDAIPSSVMSGSVNASKHNRSCIPRSVTHLKFGQYFNQPINDAIPSSVTHLTFASRFNQPINDAIPSSVTHLKININYKHHKFNYNISVSFL